jgi:predicted DNA-binding transcriptional regulator AlpA
MRSAGNRLTRPTTTTLLTQPNTTYFLDMTARPSQPVEPELLSAAQTARLLGLSESTLFALKRTGRFGPRAIRIGRAVRYVRSEIVAWLEAGADLGTLPNRAKWEEIRAARRLQN